MASSSDSSIDQYRNKQRQSIAQKASGFVKDNWVIASLLAAILSVGLFGLLSNSIPSSPSPSPNENEDGSKGIDGEIPSGNPAYWINEFDKSGHFTNFSQVLLQELTRNFKDVDQDSFQIKANPNILDKQNWKLLFNYTEQIVKGMKIIALQDDALQNKSSEFESAQKQFLECQDNLFERNQKMEFESADLISANLTIAHEEGILETLRDELAFFKQARQAQQNKTQILISQKIMERSQQVKIVEQTVDKDQFLKELQDQQEIASGNVQELSRQILVLKEQQKQADIDYSNNEDMIRTYQAEIASIIFQIERLELDSKINEIVGRVKEEEHINNTKLLVQIIQKRIRLINQYRRDGSNAIPDELIRTFENDKAQLKDLNNLQINLIRSFRKQSTNANDQEIQRLNEELILKKSLLADVKQKVDNRNSVSNEYELRISILESSITQYSDEVDFVQRKIKDLEQSFDSEGEMNVEGMKTKLNQLDEEISSLKVQRTEQDAEYSKAIKEMLLGIENQAEIIRQVHTRFGKQIKRRLELERNIVQELNKCRNYRYMMGTIESSAHESLEKVRVTKSKLIQIKQLVHSILNQMVPASIVPQRQQEEIDEHSDTRNSVAQEIADLEAETLID